MDLPHPSTSLRAIASFRPRAKRIYYYSWLLLKNLIGWTLILASGPIGLTFPGPGGFPLFLIGFAMISLPGKRKMTSSFLRGRPINRHSSRFVGWSIVAAVLLPAIIVMVFSIRFYDQMQRHGATLVFTVYAIAVVAAWMAIQLCIRAVNYGLTFVPGLRRKVRPWMRRRGIVLLPPRRRRRLQRLHDHLSPESIGAKPDVDTGILEVDERYQNSIKSFWTTARPWLKRGFGFIITAAIFGWMIHKILLHWADVKDRAGLISPVNFAIAAVMFAIFLFVFRAMSWRRIIKGFGHVIPIAPATRVWATSELARYLPGVIWQVAGRVYLVKPYGVSGTECAASQVLELVIFLLANILIGVGCLVFFGIRHVHGVARLWLFAMAAMVPLLTLLMHPRIFYGLMDRLVKRLKKPAITNRLAGSELAKLLVWAILGLLWQSIGVFLIVAQPLELAWSKWYVVAGAYCLAWCAGFLAFWAPGGLGVREAVLIAALDFALPPKVRESFQNGPARIAFLTFLSALLRLWTIAGELIVSGIAYAVDYRGAIGKHLRPVMKNDAIRIPESMTNARMLK